MDTESEKEKTKGKAKRIVLLLLLIFAALGIMIGSAFLGKKCSAGHTVQSTAPAGNSGGVDMVIDLDISDSRTSDGHSAEEQGVAISGVGYMTVPAGETEITVDLYNPEENAGLYYQTFELRLYDDGEQDYEVLYLSGLVEPGEHVRNITLSRTLEKGVYKVIIHVQPYRMDEGKTITNNADIKTELVVK